MATSALVICIGTGFTTSGAATNSLSLTTAPEYTLSDYAAANGGEKRLVDTSAAESWRLATPQRAAQRFSSERCPTARQGLRWYIRRTNDWRRKMGAGPDAPLQVASVLPCPRYLAALWRDKAHAARRAYERWHAQLTRKLLDAQFAICYVFGAYCGEALRVVECESGGSRHAHNGQYLGIFQMGSSERRLYGHGETFLAQARAAYRYFAASGFDWSPWACKP